MKYFIFVGCFGSGISELAIHHATSHALSGPSTLVDLDLVNPFFRSAEREDVLSSAGVRLIAPPFAMDKIEMAVLSSEVFAVFAKGEGTVVFDVGGDTSGSVALGRYHVFFEKIPRVDLEILFVVNPYRPLCDTAERAAAMLRAIEKSGRIKMTGLLNNANLAWDTTPEDILFGYDLIKSLSLMTDRPVYGTAGIQATLEEFLARPGLDARYTGKAIPFAPVMRRTWDAFIKKGL